MSATDWRTLLPQLDGLPLLPCIGKRPLPSITNWPTAAFTPQQVAALGEQITGCGTRTGRDAGGLLAFDLDGAAAVAWAVERHCDPAAAETWQIIRSSDPHRMKLLFRIEPELWHVLGNIHTIRQLRPPVKDPAGRILRKGEGVELYFGVGQIMLLGRHPETGGQYEWKGTPADLSEIPPAWWAAALELADNAPRLQDGQPSRSATGSADWRRLQRCPICGRDERPVCQRHRDGQTIRCFRGSTFAPPAGLKPGDVLPGGWAFARDQAVGWGEFAVFVQDKPATRLHAPGRHRRSDWSCRSGRSVNG